MKYNQEKINVRDLVVGMYVARLDRPWVGTPFPIQGFHIRNIEEINTLSHHCKHVFVDVERNNIPKALETKQPQSQSRSIASAKGSSILKFREAYKTTSPIKKEIHTATQLHKEVSVAVDHVMEKLRNGKPLSLSEIKNAANKMVDSIARNPDAMVWVCKIKDKDEHTYHHSVRASVWAIAYGRHLGLSKEDLQTLALGVLLCKVGKTKLPSELLSAAGQLTADDVKLVKKHVDYGVEILKETPGIPDEVISIVWCHNERHDGSGYPRRLSGDQIPFLAKIAGVVDYYETLTNPRPDIKPLTSSEAMAKLHDQRGNLFQHEVAEEFIQAIGIYPTGTIVQLSSGEVGVITEQNPQRRLRPVVTLVLDEHKKPLRIRRIINLLKQTKDKHGRRLDICKSLPQGAYDIDPAKIYLSTLERFLGFGGLVFKG